MPRNENSNKSKIPTKSKDVINSVSITTDKIVEIDVKSKILPKILKPKRSPAVTLTPSNALTPTNSSKIPTRTSSSNKSSRTSYTDTPNNSNKKNMNNSETIAVIGARSDGQQSAAIKQSVVTTSTRMPTKRGVVKETVVKTVEKTARGGLKNTASKDPVINLLTPDKVSARNKNTKTDVNVIANIKQMRGTKNTTLSATTPSKPAVKRGGVRGGVATANGGVNSARNTKTGPSSSTSTNKKISTNTPSKPTTTTSKATTSKVPTSSRPITVKPTVTPIPASRSTRSAQTADVKPTGTPIKTPTKTVIRTTPKTGPNASVKTPVKTPQSASKAPGSASGRGRGCVKRVPTSEFEFDLFEIQDRPKRFLFMRRDKIYIKQMKSKVAVAKEELDLLNHALFTMTDESDPFLSLLTEISHAAEGVNFDLVKTLCSQIHPRLDLSRIDWRNKRFGDHLVALLEQLKDCAVKIPRGFDVPKCVSQFRYLLEWDVNRFKIAVNDCARNYDTVRLELMRVQHEGLL